MTIMAMMSGHHGYRPTERFIRDNATALRRLLDWPRKAMPSNVSIRAILQAVDFEALAAAFRAWSADKLPDQEVVAIDGKAIRSTVTDAHGAGQDFAALVSAYGVHSGVVVSATCYRNGDTSEITAARDLIADLAAALGLGGDAPETALSGVTVTLDALHAGKKLSAPSATPAATTSSS